jgi:hypothetical protein
MNPADRPTIGMKPNQTFKKLSAWVDDMDLGVISFVNSVPDRGAAKMEYVQWDLLREVTKYHEKIVALGGFASRVLDKLNVEHFKLPHPSPRNRLLNDKEFERAELKRCKEYIES